MIVDDMIVDMIIDIIIIIIDIDDIIIVFCPTGYQHPCHAAEALETSGAPTSLHEEDRGSNGLATSGVAGVLTSARPGSPAHAGTGFAARGASTAGCRCRSAADTNPCAGM
jgi:hypothetical protein